MIGPISSPIFTEICSKKKTKKLKSGLWSMYRIVFSPKLCSENIGFYLFTEKAHICLRREINLQKDSRGYRAIPIKPYSCHKALSTMGLFVVVSCSDTTNFANHICHSQDNN